MSCPNISVVVIILVIILIIFICLFHKNKEQFSTLPAENTRYWPYYFYSYPYQYKTAGAWPPDMYTRLKFWSPGYYSGSGLQYTMRPGIGYKWWPRDRWIRKSNSNNPYYFVTNSDDYTHNAANYIGWDKLE